MSFERRFHGFSSKFVVWPTFSQKRSFLREAELLSCVLLSTNSLRLFVYSRLHLHFGFS